MQTLIAGVALGVSLLAVAVSVFATDAARRQATAAERQASLARDQAVQAAASAQAAREQVEEARRANALAERQYEERLAREAVQWKATQSPSKHGAYLRNTGTSTARYVIVKLSGDEDDWMNSERDADEVVHEEVRPGDVVKVPFIVSWGSPAPHTLYVAWDGASRLAVEIQPA